MIFGTETRAVYTMSEPSNCDIELDSFVRETSDSRCGRAISHMPCALMYDIPRSSICGVNIKTPSWERTYPNCSKVSSSRRAVGRANSVAVAMSLTVNAKCVEENARMTLSPRANDSTKSASCLFSTTLCPLRNRSTCTSNSERVRT